MAAPALSPRVQSVVADYGVFWQLWPQFEQTGGERRLAGFEVELIGSHNSELSHVDPGCPMCHRVRSVLRGIADLMLREGVLNRDSLACSIDSHANSVLCLPALANRSAVSVSVHIFWSHPQGQALETDLLATIKTSLAKYGIHQR